jgi:HEAT repeat protein
MGNRRDPAHVAPLSRALAGDGDALVRGHAAWALGRVASVLAAGEREAALAALRAAAAGDADAWVREEVRLALEELVSRA